MIEFRFGTVDGDGNFIDYTEFIQSPPTIDMQRTIASAIQRASFDVIEGTLEGIDASGALRYLRRARRARSSWRCTR